MNDTSLTVSCPKCRSPLRISLQYKYMKCGRCGSVIDTARMAAAYRSAPAGQTKRTAKHSPAAGILIAACFLVIFLAGGIILVSRLLLAEPAEVSLADAGTEEMILSEETDARVLQPGSYGLLTPDRLREISAVLAEEDPAGPAAEAEDDLRTDNAESGAEAIMPEPVQNAGDPAAETANTGKNSKSGEQTKNTGEQTKTAPEQVKNTKDLVDHTIYDDGPSGQGGAGESQGEAVYTESAPEKSGGGSQTETPASQSPPKSGSDTGREDTMEDTGYQDSGDAGGSSGQEDPGDGEEGGDNSDPSASTSSIRPDVKAVIDNYVTAQREYSEQYDSAPVSKKQKLYAAVIDTFKKFQRLGRDSSLTDEERQYYSDAEALVDQMYN